MYKIISNIFIFLCIILISDGLPFGFNPLSSGGSLSPSTHPKSGASTGLLLGSSPPSSENVPLSSAFGGGVDSNVLTDLTQMTQQMTQNMMSLSSGAGAIANASSSLIGLIGNINNGVIEIQNQIQTLSKLSTELGMKVSSKPLEIIQPLVDSQLEMAKGLSNSMVGLVEDIDKIRGSIFSLFNLIPILIGGLGLCSILLISILILIVVTWKKINSIKSRPNQHHSPPHNPHHINHHRK